MKSAYDILGVSPDASDDSIESAYRRFAKVLHPDINKRSTAATEFKELKRAYDTLIDRTERQKHDYALAVVETKNVERDSVDDVLDDYGISPKKKKKKKKKKQKSDQHSIPTPQTYSPPPYVPPAYYQQPDGPGRGEFEGIPGGYDDFDNLGGIL